MKSTYCGYMGKVAMIDLSAKKISQYPWSDSDRYNYIGGKIMAAKIMYDNLTGKEKAFSNENLIVISTGPLTGSPAPSSARFNISSVSPLTSILASSNCGGTFGYHLKKAGYDCLIIKGKCNKPTWIEIHNDEISFRSADDLWGLKISQCQNKLKEKMADIYGENIRYGEISIGPAGENLVKYAAVLSGERAAGRAGIGAVFGDKKIKAITAFGNREIPVYNREKAVLYARKWNEYLKNHPLTGDRLPKLGTASLVKPMQKKSLLATKNYKYGQYENYNEVSGETLAEKFNKINKGCLSCPIKCARTVTVDGEEIKGPELETLGLLTSGILNADLETVFKWNKELDDLGLDTISAANTVAYAMEAEEKGLWDNNIKFTVTDNISKLWEDIAYRKGIGDELAEGSRNLSEKYGGKEFAMQVKGLELAAYEPRRAVGQGLGYAVSNRGGCHLNGGYLVILEGLGLETDSQTPKAKADFTMLFQDLMEMISATGQCLFTSYAFFPGFLFDTPSNIPTKIANASIPHIGFAIRFINKNPLIAKMHLPVFHHTKMFEYVTGMKMDFGRYIRCGEVGYNLERCVNVKFGISAKDDTLPKRLTDTPQDINNPKTVVPLEKMKRTYYKARGWDLNGIPTEHTLKKLQIK